MSKGNGEGPRCPRTGRTIAEELHAAVHLLLTVPPYERSDVRYNGDEWRAYCDGYYRALAQAGAVMDLAMARRRTRAKGEYGDWSRTAIPPVPARDSRPGTRGGVRRAPGAADRGAARARAGRARDRHSHR